MSEEISPSLDENDSAGIPEISLQSLRALLGNSDDGALNNSVRRVIEEAKKKEHYAAFGNTV